MSEMLEFISASENGVTEDMLCKRFPNIKKADMAVILNSFLQQNQIEVQRSGTTLLYKCIQSRNSSYEALVLNLIAQSGSSGLWLKDIKNKTNIPHNLILKILRVLEETRRIKSIKSVKNNRKIYVLFDIKPDEDISGGVWFSNNDVDLVFVNKLMEIIYQYVRKPEGPFVLNKVDNLVKLRMVREFISTSGISEVVLTVDDVNTLIDCLVYDGKIERIEVGGDVALRALKDEYMKF
ncbi:uncharacterized protein VICG_01545 [Vittaforma corneae ATCC 50505]|uniref:DNA-directed RNA polymerase III subunit RPC6 n=1 Tax=Vittaforma corneae (strain ATCC 50505) TaxID=993615 RepID=L2GLQ9_VITCO|nr:uncharacterized protein VICG_01545 [Vittaforma corneae ATCC 50505]ELA41440.1 hypothetical protein VICG_01545 [Vittaforma corneae ATCC 50505]